MSGRERKQGTNEHGEIPPPIQKSVDVSVKSQGIVKLLPQYGSPLRLPERHEFEISLARHGAVLWYSPKGVPNPL